MKPFNWTDCEHPCFEDYKFSFGEDDGPMECDDDEMFTCRPLAEGGTWEDCKSGRLSKWCDWLPKETTNE